MAAMPGMTESRANLLLGALGWRGLRSRLTHSSSSFYGTRTACHAPKHWAAACLPSCHSGMDQGRPHEWGVFARRALVRGTLLGELTGLVCTGEVSGQLGPSLACKGAAS